MVGKSSSSDRHRYVVQGLFRCSQVNFDDNSQAHDVLACVIMKQATVCGIMFRAFAAFLYLRNHSSCHVPVSIDRDVVCSSFDEVEIQL